MTEYYEISHSSIQSEEVLLTLTGVSFINVCHASITYMYINPSLRSIEATSIQMSKKLLLICTSSLHQYATRRYLAPYVST